MLNEGESEIKKCYSWDSTVDHKFMNVMYVVINFCYMDLGAVKINLVAEF
jgi:hypothetical protein